jgi:hypothetical protein
MVLEHHLADVDEAAFLPLYRYLLPHRQFFLSLD